MAYGKRNKNTTGGALRYRQSNVKVSLTVELLGPRNSNPRAASAILTVSSPLPTRINYRHNRHNIIIRLLGKIIWGKRERQEDRDAGK